MQQSKIENVIITTAESEASVAVLPKMMLKRDAALPHCVLYKPRIDETRQKMRIRRTGRKARTRTGKECNVPPKPRYRNNAKTYPQMT